MPADRIVGAFAILAVFSVLMIFLCPAMQGPYCVVHGPVTALLSVRAAASLRWKTVRTGLSMLCDRLHRSVPMSVFLGLGGVVAFETPMVCLAAGSNSILRC